MNLLTIFFERCNDGFECWVMSPDGLKTGPRTFRPSKDLERELHWYFAEYAALPLAPDKPRAERVEQHMRAWGMMAYQALVGRELDQTIGTQTNRDGVTTWTIVARDPAIARLPWELLHDGNEYVLQRGVSIRRTLETADVTTTKVFRGKSIRMLVVVPSPRGLPFLDSRPFLHALYDVAAVHRGNVHIDICRPPTVLQMQTMLNESMAAHQPYDIVHFRGHAGFSSKAAGPWLQFEAADPFGDLADSMPVQCGAFAALFKQYAPRLVVLDACSTDAMSWTPQPQTFAAQLLAVGVDHVITMRDVVHVEATRILFETFYRSLFAGASVCEAMHHGRIALERRADRQLENVSGGASIKLQDWCVPVLYQRVANSAIVRPRQTSSIPVKQNQNGCNDTRIPQRFHGRGLEIVKMERRFRVDRSIVLHGMGGTGKTHLAREAADFWTQIELFPDGICFVSFEFGVTAAVILSKLASSLQVSEYANWPESERRQRIVEMFQERAILMIWDNFESILPEFQEAGLPALFEPQEVKEIKVLFRQLTENANGAGRILLTSRAHDVQLGRVARIALECLDLHSALSLLIDGMGSRTRKYPRASLERLLHVLGCHPLSIKLVAPELADKGPNRMITQLEAIVERLQDNDEEPRNRSLRASLQVSMRRLTTSAREVLRALAWFRGGVHERLLAGFVGTSHPQREQIMKEWKQIMEELQRNAIIRVEGQPNGLSYIHMHPTLPYLLPQNSVVNRMKKQFVFVSAYRGWTAEYSSRVKRSPYDEAVRMIRLESQNILRAIGFSIELGAISEATGLADSLNDVFERELRIHLRDRLVKWLFACTRNEPLEEHSVLRHVDYADMLWKQGKPRKALRELRGLLEMLGNTTTGVDFRVTRVRTELGHLYVSMNAYSRATTVLHQAIAEWGILARGPRRKGHDKHLYRNNLASAHNYLAEALMGQGQWTNALKHLETSKKLWWDKTTQYAFRIRKGYIQAKRGKYKDAIRWYGFALHLARRAKHRDEEVNVLQALSELYLELGKIENAEAHLQEVCRILEAYPDRQSQIRAHLNVGNSRMLAGRFDEAEQWYDSAVVLAGNIEGAQASIMFSRARASEIRANEMIGRGHASEARRANMQAVVYFVRCMELRQALDDVIEMEACAQAVRRVYAKVHNAMDCEPTSDQLRSWLASCLAEVS